MDNSNKRSGLISPEKQLGPVMEAVSTPEIQQWLSSIEQCLNDICDISGGGKMNSEQKLKISNLTMSVLSGASQMAVQYQSLKQKYISASTLAHTLREQVDISAQLQDLKECVQAAPNTSLQNLSFADMVRNGGPPLIRPPSTSSISIFPTNKSKTSADTKELVQNPIRPKELKLHIRGVRKTKNGGVIISSERKDDLEKLKKSEKLITSGLLVKVEETTKRRPKVIILGVPSDVSEKEVFDCLYEQNVTEKHPSLTRDAFDSSVNLSHKSGKRDASSCNYVIELTAQLNDKLKWPTFTHVIL